MRAFPQDSRRINEISAGWPDARVICARARLQFSRRIQTQKNKTRHEGRALYPARPGIRVLLQDRISPTFLP
jgi:hypothetical protein